MTSRTREIYDFAQLEPLAIADIESLIQVCDEEEIDHVEHVALAILEAIKNLSSPNGVLELFG